MAKFSFADTIKKLRETPKGKEASMYGPIRDIFIHVLGYPAADVDIDTAGEEGRPDVTARAPAGYLAKGKEAKIDWVVVEAKDEHECFSNPFRRETIFAGKSKYVGAHTAWFVMVEPDHWVLRPVSGGTLTSDADIEVPLLGLSEEEFRRLAVGLLFESAGTSLQLQRFRDGDISLIATDKLTADPITDNKRDINRARLNRRRFFDQVREATAHLQSAAAGAFARVEDEIKQYANAADAFWMEFGKAELPFDEHDLELHGSPKGPEAVKRHRREVARLKRLFAKSPHIARLAVSGLPDFQSRTGVDDNKLKDLFVIETANLILARVLLLRFFEDHGFFGDMRYVCNGGVAAFQNMRSYFKSSYAKLLEHAYQEGSRLYAAAFDATELDWIFGSGDEGLSSGIELTMFRFARYDFRTVKGDILTGIYDRFMDRDQRKRLGEFYTPPSIARYMLKRVGVEKNSRIFDPACGSGTFLIEGYRAMIGNDVDRGAADYEDVLDVFGRIAGNDLNTFSAVLTQIQLLWQVLSLKDDIADHGFPDVQITAKVNSLIERDQWTALDRFAEIDVPEYDAVIGNPPYVRAERSAQDLDKNSAKMFERGSGKFPGVSSKLNAFALFLYRALDRWTRPAAGDAPAGKVAFILPVSLFDANENSELRKLFKPGGRWTIREVVDLEVIYRKVFDADVLPAILIAENRPPKEDDTVSVRFADHSCVLPQEASALPEFDLEGLPESIIPYADLFSPDGRILTRATPARLTVLHKLWRQQTFTNAAKPYWVRKDGSKIVEWVDEEPTVNGWEERRMIGGGIAFRGSKAQTSSGIDVYKGENIIAAELQGEPALPRADFSKIDDISLWRYKDIHPAKGLAVPRVAHCANGIMFDPTKQAFTNTATLLFPRDDLVDVPFDLLLLSNVYVWFYALAARMGILRTLRSDIYPTNLAFLPWSEQLAASAAEIEALRPTIITACKQRIATSESLKVSLGNLKLSTLKQQVAADAEARLLFGGNFSEAKYEAVIGTVSVGVSEDGWYVSMSDDLFDRVECNREEIAIGLALALKQREGESMSKNVIHNLPTPVGVDEMGRWNAVVAKHDEDAVIQAMDTALGQLDSIVGASLCLSEDDLAFIKQDLCSDPFLQGIRPRYPGTVTRKQGFRTGLDSESRYD